MKRKTKDNPLRKTSRKAVSLFSGAGGMDIGIREAGFEILAEIELDEHCCSTLRANAERSNDSVRIIQADIREIDPK
ncbi:MAG TPA: DNA cytosine methyltransferase, partial [Planctomycetes bacterium]|nr:DNA cytosine methyltransferase [Planctomycetota bacterium]